MPESIPLVRMHDVTVERGRREILGGVSLELHAAQIVGLSGPSGCGKSTLAQVLLGLGPVRSGLFEVDGTDMTRASESNWRTVRGGRIALIPQHARSALDPLKRIVDQVARVGRRVRGLGTADARSEAETALANARFPTARSGARPHALSGGECQRAVIAMALIARPGLLIADEPTAALDPVLTRDVIMQLVSCAQELKACLLLISHDERVLDAVCTARYRIAGGALRRV